MTGDMTVAETEAVTEKFQNKLQAAVEEVKTGPAQYAGDARLRGPVEGPDRALLPTPRWRRASPRRRSGASPRP